MNALQLFEIGLLPGFAIGWFLRDLRDLYDRIHRGKR